MSANYVAAYVINGELYAHEMLSPEAIKVSVIAPDHPDFDTLAILVGFNPQAAQGEPS